LPYEGRHARLRPNDMLASSAPSSLDGILP
jgi:hypothetical protein